MNEPNVNCGLWVMIMCPCRFIDCASDEGVTVGGDCDCVCVGGGGRGLCEISVLSSQFCCESKTALRNRVYFKI